LSKVIKMIRDLLLFKEPTEQKPFVLAETNEKGQDSGPEKADKADEDKPRRRKNENLLLHPRKDLKAVLKKSEKVDKEKTSDISCSLAENLTFVKEKFHYPDNSDLVIREFDIVVKDAVIAAFLFFYDGMSDTRVINMDILQPLMLLSNLDIKSDGKGLSKFITSHILPHNQIKEVNTHQEIIDMVNFGGCGIYVDGLDVAFAADVKNLPGRGIEKPNTELVIRGAQEGFNENIRNNTALIRKRLKDEDLVAENISLGRRSKTPCAMMFIKDIANDALVGEVRRRLKNIKVDHIMDSGELEQFIEDNPLLPTPQVIATERPDRVCGMLAEGRVAIIMQGSPFVLVVPVTNDDIFHAAEDQNLRFPYANLLRLIRIFAIIMSLLLPGLYVAITNFHHEMIPTDLLLAIMSAREKVPFPSVVEVFIMEISFELIREAGIRIPGPIGPTLGIIGALILGQAAVAANIVSPILIIVVAVTGIGSFAIPNFSAGFAFRILRFGFIILGALAGFLGIAAGLVLLGFWMVSAKSFGVPFVVPVGPRTKGGFSEATIKEPIYKQENRPDFINPKDPIKQAKMSRAWVRKADESEIEKQEE
jgi:spore germination protein KA